MNAYVLVVVSYVAHYTAWGPVNTETGRTTRSTVNSHVVNMQDFNSKESCEEVKNMVKDYVLKAECKKK